MFVPRYNVWSACVGPSMEIVDASVCNDNTGNSPRGALRGILPMLDSQTLGRPGFSKSGHFEYGFAGGWNHLDQLAVGIKSNFQGPGITLTEGRAQLALWATLASPLILAFDLWDIDPPTLALITNKGAIAVSQVSTEGGRPLKATLLANGTIATQVYGRVLQPGAAAVVLFNRLEHAANITVDLTDDLAPLNVSFGSAHSVTLTDVWTGKKVAAAAVPGGSYTATVPPHDVAFFRVDAAPPNVPRTLDD